MHEHDRVAARQKLFDERASDELGAADDEYTSHCCSGLQEGDRTSGLIRYLGRTGRSPFTRNVSSW